MVKHTDFKTCAQSAFCKRQQAYADLVDRDLTYNATYSIVPHSVVLSPETGAIDLKIMGVEMTDVYLVRFVTSRLNTVRFTLKERDIPVERYAGAAKFSIQEELVAVNFTVKAETRELVQVIFGNDGQNSLAISSNPFAFQLAVNGVVAIKFNDRGYFYHEDYRPKSDTSVPRFAAQVPVVEGQDDAVVKANGLKDALVSGYWEEEFNGHKDTKPNGPTSIGLDLTFPDSSDVYGLPEHASSYSLKTTRGEGAAYKEPYRLYNLDVFEHELDNPMALYGSVPFMMSHKIGQTSAILWLNAAEMWIDVEKPAPLKGQKQYVATHWMVESGPADLVFFLGPTQKDIFNAYTTLTGRPQLPQAFAIAYHQCRWNYNTQLDVEQVDANFDLFDIPYDVLWLDIEHTDEKKYFTWDKVKFADPVGMQKKLGEVSRKMVTIVDPHIKNDKTYSVSQNARELGEFVMGADNSVFEGSCWPGSSNWIDYTKESARVYWADLFSYKNYEGSTPTLYTWNDMNEPSVFSGPEVTMPKTALHEGGVEHRDVHNMYGMLQHSATYLGHLNREQGTDRPFILSRSFFAGTQRYGAIWTGDNTASWDYLKLTVPMLLNLGVSGITFCGADVGGFFGNPDPELLMRWYQIGALQPFFRAHAEFNTKRREPWLFGEPWTSLIRESVRMRYRLLPYLYTLFHEAHTSGIPIMRYA